MSIYICGDTHGWIDSDKLFDNKNSLCENDFLIIAGDAGFVWQNSKYEINLRKQLYKLPYTILFVDGNHENFDLLNQYKVQNWNGGKVHKINDKLIHLMRSQIFEIEDKTIFTFGGAISIDKEKRAEFISWWRQEVPSFIEQWQAIEKLNNCGNKVDYVITHEMPFSSLMKMVDPSCRFMFENDVQKQFLDDIKLILDYKHWYCGHHHTDETIVEDNLTVLYKDIIKIN